MDNLELRRYLDPVAVGVLDKDEEVVSRAVTTWTPYQRDTKTGKPVGPVADGIPFAGFVAVMIDALPVRFEEGDGVMLVI